jgi:hypothetical protein
MFKGGERKFTDFGAYHRHGTLVFLVELCWRKGKALGSEGGKG